MLIRAIRIQGQSQIPSFDPKGEKRAGWYSASSLGEPTLLRSKTSLVLSNNDIMAIGSEASEWWDRWDLNWNWFTSIQERNFVSLLSMSNKAPIHTSFRVGNVTVRTVGLAGIRPITDIDPRSHRVLVGTDQAPPDLGDLTSSARKRRRYPLGVYV